MANKYLTLYPQGDDLIVVLKILAEAYLSEYEIEKALEVCGMLHAQEYEYIHSYYCDCLYKLNRLDEAVTFLEDRLAMVKTKYGQEPDERQLKVINSIINHLEKYKKYVEEGKKYIPVTEKGRQKLGIKIDTINTINLKYDFESLPDTDTFVVFDFETTGFSAKWHEITEIGAVKIVKGKIVDRFSTLVKPRRKISEEITEITGITNEMVADAPNINSVISEFKEFIDGFDLVGHNLSFDMKFLDINLAKVGKSISCKKYDTLKLVQKYFKGMRSYKLADLSIILNIEHTNAHRALSDAETTAELYMKCFNASK